MTHTPSNGSARALPDDHPRYREPRIEAPSPTAEPQEWLRSLARRMKIATDMCSLRNVGARVGSNQETVRRHMRGGKPSALFLASLCEAFVLSPEWLLTGKGPMRPPISKEVLARLRALQRLTSTALAQQGIRALQANGNGRAAGANGVKAPLNGSGGRTQNAGANATRPHTASANGSRALTAGENGGRRGRERQTAALAAKGTPGE